MKRSESSASLSEVHRSVSIPANAGFVKRLFAFAGPAYLVSVGYMDPGNWATDLEGGARFGYQLVWVLLMSNMMAILLQTLSARMGIVAGMDLAQASRANYPRPVAYALWILCEVAIAACDLAEVLGTAIGLNLLFGIPLIWGVVLTGFDTMLFLVIQNFGIRRMEAFIIALVATIGGCFAVEIFLSSPDWGGVVGGFVPRLNTESLYVAIGILGATVMPHNLYLHSALVQTRSIDVTDEGKRQACKMNLIDTAVALNAALFVNGAILIVASSVFFANGVLVTEIQQAHELLEPLLGTVVASTLFAVALIAAGQSSTLTGTLAGQIVMEGFIRFRMRPWVRRLITRMIAIVPAVIVISMKGEEGSYGLLILSQVILSLQLPFAIIPLIKITSDRSVMGDFTNKLWVKVLAWTTAIVVVGLNARLVYGTLSTWMADAGPGVFWIWVTVVPAVVAICLLLVYISLPKSLLGRAVTAPVAKPHDLSAARYSKIGVAVDYSDLDSKVLAHAITLARGHGAPLFLFHVVEGVSGQLFGNEAADEEARGDRERLDAIAAEIRAGGAHVTAALGFGSIPEEIIRLSRENGIDILVMGGHRHRGLKDVLLGATISTVRHALPIPVLIIQ